MSTNEQRIIDKIQKCLALSESSNAHEATAALRQAQALMRKYNIDEASIAESAIDAVEAEGHSSAAVRVPAWEQALISIVGRAFGCHALLIKQMPHRGSRRTQKARFKFVGMKANAIAAAYCATVLLRQLGKNRKQHLQTLRAEAKSEGWRLTHIEEQSAVDAYSLGWLREVDKGVVLFANPDGIDTAIARYKAGVTKGRTEKQQCFRYGDWDTASVSAGAEAGRAVRLHHGVGGTGTAAALPARITS